MQWNEHSRIKGKHAFLSPSKYHWVNYNKDKLEKAYKKHRATVRGTAIHDVAAECINIGEPLTETNTMVMFVNDSIYYKMQSEIPLYYSDDCYGHADAIGFNGQILRISDLKTGESKPSLEQLRIYAAIFCLEYGFDPMRLNIILRIYQLGEILEDIEPNSRVSEIMDIIVEHNLYLQSKE